MPYDQVMHKWKTGQLHSGSKSGPKVSNRQQAIAIMLSEKRAAGNGKKEYSASSKKSGKSKASTRLSDSSSPRGALSSKPRVFSNPPTLDGRRALSRRQYGNSKG